MTGIVRRIADIIVPALTELTKQEKRDLHKAFLLLEATFRDVAVLRAGGTIGASGGGTMEGPGIDIVGKRVGLGGDSVLLLDSDGEPVSEFNTLALANLSAASGDIIKLPVGTHGGNVTIVDGVKVVGESRYATILTGEIIGGDEASIENLSVIRTANDGSTLKGVVVDGADTFYINGCDIKVTQSGAGDARALSSEANSSVIEVWNSYMKGDSTSGSGWGLWRNTGLTTSIFVHGCRAAGSTNPANDPA